MKLQNPYKNYPQSYDDFDQLVKSGHSATQIGFQTDNATVYRFINRFRLAREFIEIRFEAYKSDTASGYNGICEVFLADSAFELFLKIFGMSQATVNNLIAAYNPAACIQGVVNADLNRRFYNFLESQLETPNAKNNLSSVYNGTSANVTYLASSIRHIFAHGHLSAHVNKCKPETIKEICDKIFEFHLTFMDSEFTKVIQIYRSSI